MGTHMEWIKPNNKKLELSLPLRWHICIMFLTRKQWRTIQSILLLNVLLYLLMLFILFSNLSIYYYFIVKKKDSLHLFFILFKSFYLFTIF